MGCSFLDRETHQDFVDMSSVGPGVAFELENLEKQAREA